MNMLLLKQRPHWAVKRILLKFDDLLIYVRKPYSDKINQEPKDPPKPYSSKAFKHTAFKPPQSTPLKAFREFKSSDEVLGPDASKTKCYKNPEYFSYHRFSFVTLQKATIALRQAKVDDKLKEEESEEVYMEEEKIDVREEEKEGTANVDNLEEHCKQEAERLKEEAKRFKKQELQGSEKNAGLIDYEIKVEDVTLGKEAIQFKKETERLEEEAERYKIQELEECKIQKEMQMKVEGATVGEEEKKYKKEAERLRKEAERYQKQEMEEECQKKKEQQCQEQTKIEKKRGLIDYEIKVSDAALGKEEKPCEKEAERFKKQELEECKKKKEKETQVQSEKESGLTVYEIKIGDATLGKEAKPCEIYAERLTEEAERIIIQETEQEGPKKKEQQCQQVAEDQKPALSEQGKEDMKEFKSEAASEKKDSEKGKDMLALNPAVIKIDTRKPKTCDIKTEPNEKDKD